MGEKYYDTMWAQYWEKLGIFPVNKVRLYVRQPELSMIVYNLKIFVLGSAKALRMILLEYK